MQLNSLRRRVVFLNSLHNRLRCKFFGRRSSGLCLWRLENRIREDGELIFVFIGSIVLVLVRVVVNVEAEALLLRILPIDARLCIALMVSWICALMG